MEAATDNFRLLPHLLEAEFDAFDDKGQQKFNVALVNRNGLIVEFNELKVHKIHREN